MSVKLPRVIPGGRALARTLRLHLDHQRNPLVLVSYNGNTNIRVIIHLKADARNISRDVTTSKYHDTIILPYEVNDTIL